MSEQTVLWGKFLGDYALWRTADLPGPSTTVTDLPSVDPKVVTKFLEQLCANFEESSQPLGDIFPMLFRLENVTDLYLSVPVRNAVARNGFDELSKLLILSPKVLRSFRNVGRTIYVSLFASCLEASFKCLNSRGSHTEAGDEIVGSLDGVDSGSYEEVSSTEEAGILDETFSRLIESIEPPQVKAIARATLITHFLSRPESYELAFTSSQPSSFGSLEVIKLALPLTPKVLLKDFVVPTCKQVLESFLSSLEDKEKTVLDLRVLKEKPDTLDETGAKLGLTRERARQIEVKVRAKYLQAKTENTYLSALVFALQSLLGQPQRVADLRQNFAQFAERLEERRGDVFDILSRLEGFEVLDGWVYVDRQSSIDSIKGVFAELEESERYPHIAQVLERLVSLWPSMTPKIAQEWLELNGWQVFDGRCVWAKGMSQVAWGLAILEIVGKPMSMGEIFSKLPMEANSRAFSARMQESGQVSRTGLDKYGLASWAQPEFKGIRETLKEIIQEHGSVSLNAMISKFVTEHGVAAKSVEAYAKQAPFKVENGFIKWADANQALPLPTRKSSFKNFYVLPDGYAWRVVVNQEHLRGSGSVVPAALAYFLGVNLGVPKQFTSPHGSVRLSFTGNAKNIGSIRQACTDLGAGVGDQIVIRFIGQQATFSVVDFAKTGEALVRELSALPDSGDLHAQLALALGVDADISMIDMIELVGQRGDSNLLVALSALPNPSQL